MVAGSSTRLASPRVVALVDVALGLGLADAALGEAVPLAFGVALAEAADAAFAVELALAEGVALAEGLGAGRGGGR